jgi:hypothetical protein
VLRSPVRVIVLVLLLGLFLAACGGAQTDRSAQVGTPGAGEMPMATATGAPATAVVSEQVPAEFQSTYEELQTSLEAERDVYAGPQGPEGASSLALELLTANGNRGEDLLQPSTLEATRLFLDRFKELGATAVTLQIVYPLFDEGFPRHDEYVDFYRAVVREVRQRGLLLLIETSAPFVGTEYSSLHVDYGGKTPEVYLQERLEQARTIAHELLPDYLTLTEEQSTERMLTGLDLSTDVYLKFLRDAPAVIAPPPGVKLGAGSGSWESPELMQRIIRETLLDYVDIHVYPLSNGFTDYLEVAADWASAARAAGKDAVIGEAWLYKVSAGELQGGIGFQEAFGRDEYSFWEPLDVLFMQTVVELGRVSGVRLLSFFWSNYLFAYVDYDQVSPGLSRSELQQASNIATWRAVVGGELSAAGTEFRRLASESSGAD